MEGKCSNSTKPRAISVQCRIRASRRLTYYRTYMDGKPETKKHKMMPGKPKWRPVLVLINLFPNWHEKKH